MKHIIFISEDSEKFINNDLLVKKLIKKWNDNIYGHYILNDFLNKVIDSNIIILFNKKLKDNKYFIENKENLKIYILNNFKNNLSKKDEKSYIKLLRYKINKILSSYALVRVTDYHYYYRDIDFKKIKKKNIYKADVKYIEDKDGDFLSYDNKKLKAISKKTFFTGQTYDEHLTSEEIFHIEKYPYISYTKLLHYFTFDIETLDTLDIINVPKPIISICAYSNIYNKYFFWILKKDKEQIINKDKFNIKIFEFNDEVKMLKHFLYVIYKLEIDMIGGYNIDYFDIPYLLRRCEKLNINYSFVFKNIYQQIGKENEKYFLCKEIIFWDYLKYAKWIISSNKPLSWSLDNVAKHYLNEEKIKHEGISNLWNEKCLDKLIEYNLKDVDLTEKLVKKLKLIEFPNFYQRISPQRYENVYYNSKFLDILIHQYFKQYKFPSKKKISKEKPYKGALVLDTKQGLFKNVSVFDFSALYPSIMITFNLSKDTIISDEEYNKDTDISIDNVKFTTKKKGIVSQLSEHLLQKRFEINKKKNLYNADTQEYKILNNLEMVFKATCNALYGVLGYSGFFLYDERVASSVTFIARNLLIYIKNQIEKQQYDVLFGDTDSIAIEFKTDNFDEAIEKSKLLEEYLNKNLYKFVSNFTNNKEIINNHKLKIVFEKSYSKLLLINAKKKQVGFLKYFKGKFLDKEELNIKGFEAIKDDCPEYFKNVLTNLYKIILNYYNDLDKIKAFIKEIKKDLYKQDPSFLVIRKKLRKSMDEYDSDVQHIKALKNSNIILRQGEIVNILFVTDYRKVIHYDPLLNLNFTIDYKKYFNDFLIKKIQLIDENLYRKLFVKENKLIDISKENLEKYFQNKKNKKIENIKNVLL